MTPTEPLDVLPLWAFFLVTFLAVYAAVEGGYRAGRYRRRVSETEKEATVGPIVGATLGLLAFMLAFTFSMAATRFDARRQMVVEESNAIGTTYLRAGLLDEPHQSQVRGLLREYVDVRLAAVETGDVAAAIARSQELHDALWAHAVALAKNDSHSIVAGLFTQSLNETIDLHASRVLIGVRSRIPIIIWITLYLVAVLAMAQLGYHAGLTASRRSLACVSLVATFSLVMLLIADLDRQREGLISVSQQAMIELRQSMQATDPLPGP